MRKKACAKCGREEAFSGEFMGAFCPSCFAGTGTLKTGTARLAVCPRCERIRVRNQWSKETPELVLDLAASKVKGRYPVEKAGLVALQKKRNEWLAMVSLQFSAEGKRVEEVQRVRIEVRRMLCPDCHRLASGYHEFILQLRGPPKKVEKMAAWAQEELEKDTLVTKAQEQPQGIDLYIADKHPAMQLVMRLHRPYQATRSLKGVRRGKHHFITTVCIRL